MVDRMVQLHDDQPALQDQLRNAFKLLFGDGYCLQESAKRTVSRRDILEARLFILKYCGDFEIQSMVVKMLLSDEDVLEFGDYFANVWFKDSAETISAFKFLLLKPNEDLNYFIGTLNREKENPYVYSIRCSLLSWNKTHLSPSRKGSKSIWLHLNRGTKTLSISGLDVVPTCLDNRGYIVLPSSDIEKTQVYPVEIPFGPVIQGFSICTKQGNLVLFPDPLLSEEEWGIVNKTMQFIVPKIDMNFGTVQCNANYMDPCSNVKVDQITQTNLLVRPDSSSGNNAKVKMMHADKDKKEGECSKPYVTAPNIPGADSRNVVNIGVISKVLGSNVSINTSQTETFSEPSGTMQKSKGNRKKSVPLRNSLIRNQTKADDSSHHIEQMCFNSIPEKNSTCENDATELASGNTKGKQQCSVSKRRLSSSSNIEAEQQCLVSTQRMTSNSNIEAKQQCLISARRVSSSSSIEAEEQCLGGSRRMTRGFKVVVEKFTGVAEPFKEIKYSPKRSKMSRKSNKIKSEELQEENELLKESADNDSESEALIQDDMYSTPKLPNVNRSGNISVENPLKSLSSIEGDSVHSWTVKTPNLNVTPNHELDDGFSEYLESELNGNSNSAVVVKTAFEQPRQVTIPPAIPLANIVKQRQSYEKSLQLTVAPNCLSAEEEKPTFSSMDVPGITLNSSIINALMLDSMPLSGIEAEALFKGDAAPKSLDQSGAACQYKNASSQDSTSPPLKKEVEVIDPPTKDVMNQDLDDAE